MARLCAFKQVSFQIARIRIVTKFRRAVFWLSLQNEKEKEKKESTILSTRVQSHTD